MYNIYKQQNDDSTHTRHDRSITHIIIYKIVNYDRRGL